MVFKNLYVLMLWTKVASALEECSLSNGRLKVNYDTGCTITTEQ